MLHTTLIAINSTFVSFYSLYSSEAPSDSTEMHAFLDELNFPNITPEDAAALDCPLIPAGIILAIENMQ